MQMSSIPFEVTDWSTIEPSRHAGETGFALWRTQQFGAIRVRMVESPPPTWPITGAARAISCCAWKGNFIRSLRMAEPSPCCRGQAIKLRTTPRPIAQERQRARSCSSWTRLKANPRNATAAPFLLSCPPLHSSPDPGSRNLASTVEIG